MYILTNRTKRKAFSYNKSLLHDDVFGVSQSDVTLLDERLRFVNTIYHIYILKLCLSLFGEPCTSTEENQIS